MSSSKNYDEDDNKVNREKIIRCDTRGNRELDVEKELSQARNLFKLSIL